MACALGSAVVALAACHRAAVRNPSGSPAAPVRAPATDAPVARPAAPSAREVLAYAGVDAHGVPRYDTRAFTDEERALLRTVYGVADPNRLYLSDSSATRVLKYDTRPKPCRTCYVNSYRVGFVSVRRAGESWDDVEQRVRRMRPWDFARGARAHEASLRALDPDVEPVVARLLDDARRAGFRVRVTATYRSPEREAYLMAAGGGQTHTLTSLHSYGRALDVDLLEGRRGRRAPRAHWVAFRRWVLESPGHAFRLVGTPSQTWDWRHIEIPGPEGFRSVDEALSRARACSDSLPRAVSATGVSATGVSATGCDFAPHLSPTAR